VAPEEVESFDFTKPIRKKKVTTTSEANGIKKRKTRSDKGKKRGPKKTAGSYEAMKAEAIAEALK
jgi:hypothetical protein